MFCCSEILAVNELLIPANYPFLSPIIKPAKNENTLSNRKRRMISDIDRQTGRQFPRFSVKVFDFVDIWVVDVLAGNEHRIIQIVNHCRQRVSILRVWNLFKHRICNFTSPKIVTYQVQEFKTLIMIR